MSRTEMLNEISSIKFKLLLETNLVKRNGLLIALIALYESALQEKN